MTTTDHAAEVAHDEKLLELLWEQGKAQHAFEARGQSLIELAAKHPESGYKHGYIGRTYALLTPRKAHSGHTYMAFVPVSDALAWVEKLAVEGPIEGMSGYDRTYGYGSAESAAKYLASYHEAIEALATAKEAVMEHEKGYTGWSRFFLVTSSAGHVHASMQCSSCYASTTYAPVPSLSGSDESEAVAKLGQTMCTVCFPSAPAKPSKITLASAQVLAEKGEAAFTEAVAKAKVAAEKRAAKKAEREAARQARLAAKGVAK